MNNFPTTNDNADDNLPLTSDWIESEYNSTPVPEGGWCMRLVSELSHWTDYGITTRGQLKYSLLCGDYSDKHKEVYGFRPRGGCETIEAMREFMSTPAKSGLGL